MISISKPLSAGKTSQYYREEYSAKSSYYSESETLKGDWYGKAAEAFGLAGQQVRAEHFDRLAQGQHPITGEQLIKHRDTIRTREGGEVGHRSAWDLTISAPKSVSIAALVGVTKGSFSPTAMRSRRLSLKRRILYRRGWVANVRRRRQARPSSPHLTTTPRARWMDTPPRSFTLIWFSSI